MEETENSTTPATDGTGQDAPAPAEVTEPNVTAAAEPPPKVVGLDELLALREQTERVSDFLYKRLKDHLAALTPLFAPTRVFGKHAGGRDAVPRADEALAELTEKYRQVCTSLTFLKPELDDEVLTAIGPGLGIYPYEYSREAQSPKGTKNIAMTSPVQWVVSYSGAFSLSQMRTLLGGGGERGSLPVRQFVVNALAFQVVMGRNPALAQLFKDLRYHIGVQPLPGVQGLPLAVFSLRVPSFRPADDLLLTAIRLSGVNAFIELIVPNVAMALEDPLRAQIESLSSSAPAS